MEAWTMEYTSLLIMEREKDTGFLGRELGSYEVKFDTNLVDRVFAEKEDDNLVVHMYITAPGEYKDWEYNAILDNYNLDLYEGKVMSIEENEDSYNPVWLVKFEFLEDDNSCEGKINEVLEIHDAELKRVLEEIKGLEEEYKE
jgi:hypothetical protein